MAMKKRNLHIAVSLFSAFAFSLPLLGAEKRKDSENFLLNASPHTPAAKILKDSSFFAGRAPASVNEVRDRNAELLSKIKPGSRLIVQNSLKDWNDEIVEVTDIFEGGNIRVKLSSGERAFIRFQNLAHNLSAAVDCTESHGVNLCKEDMVFYPARTTSFEIPEAKVVSVFENNTVIVQDGLQMVFDAEQLGKEVESGCSEREGKAPVCLNDYVFAEGFRNKTRFPFEGKIVKTFTNGIVIVKSGLWRFPIAAEGVKKRIASTAESDNNPAVITTRTESKPNLS